MCFVSICHDVYMLLKCIFVWENKSLTITGDEEYVYLQFCLEYFC